MTKAVKKGASPKLLDQPIMAQVIEREIEVALDAMGCSDLEIAGMALAIASDQKRAMDTAARIIPARLSTSMRAMQNRRRQQPQGRRPCRLLLSC